MIFRDPPTRTGPAAGPGGAGGLSAVADLLLSGPGDSPAVPARAPAAAARAAEPSPRGAPAVAEADVTDGPAPEAAPPRGVYMLVPAGVNPAARRQAALDAAARLAARDRPAAVLLFEGGRVDAHVLGETAGGRLGPQNYFGGADLGQAVRRLADHCDPIALVPLDAPEAVFDGLPPAVERPVFLVDADAESLVEAYRTLKTWRQAGAAGRSAVLYGDGSPAAAGPRHARLRQAARAFLGCDLARQRTRHGDAARRGMAAASGVRVFAGARAEDVWAPLLAVAAEASAAGAVETPPAERDVPETVAAEPAAPAVAEDTPVRGVCAAPHRAAGPAPSVRPAFTLWRPESRDELLDAMEAQLPALLGEAYPHVFRVDVAEPGAPPLVAVRLDGTLVALRFGEANEAVPTEPTRRWLRVHWPLLVRAYPHANLPEEPRVETMVLAAARPDPSDGTVHRFVPVRLGGHKGIVLLA